jgi:hypothetical protein
LLDPLPVCVSNDHLVAIATSRAKRYTEVPERDAMWLGYPAP